MTICCVCIFLLLMCAFFVDGSYAAQIKSGTTTRKEQTVKLNLQAGTAVITVSDANSWVFAQLQTTGSHKLGKAVNGEKTVSNLGQKKTFTVQVKKAGAYYLYLHGVNSGAAYSVQQFYPGGTLKSGTPLLGTSYADNKSIVYYTIKVPDTGVLRITVKDASYLYPGYSKIQLKKGNSHMSGEEHLIKGLGFSTVYGLSKGTYNIGVRSSSELYSITATFSRVATSSYGKTKTGAVEIGRNVLTKGIIEPVNQNARWYRVNLPEKSDKHTSRNIHVRVLSNNRILDGGIAVVFQYKSTTNGETVTKTDKYIMNNDEQDFNFKQWKNKTRPVFIKVASAGGLSGLYEISWK